MLTKPLVSSENQGGFYKNKLEKKLHSTKKSERENPLGFFNIHSVAKYQKIVPPWRKNKKTEGRH